MDDLIREMITPARAAVDRPRRRRLVTTAVTVALAAAGVTSLTTGALFTDTDTLSATDFTTGTVQITPTMSGTITLGAANLAPGDTSFGLVDVQNAGSLAQRYAVSMVATNATGVNLAAELDLAVYTTGAASCSVAGVAALTPVASATGLPTAMAALIGDPAPGAHGTPGGGDRWLSTLTGETLCFAVHLPVSTPNAFQGASASLELTFDAEQVANNP